jgi:putative ABC transport system permease protein
MKLFDLTLRNVRRNFRLYTIYLVSMIIGVIIHFTFSALMFNPDILDMVKNRGNFQNGIMIASGVVFVFIIVFILYANSFFMRQRQREFGLYLLLGLSERQITWMVFYETLILSGLSLSAGILLGGFLSKLFGMLLMKLMQYEETVSFSFPLQAIGTTAALFLLLSVIIAVQSHIAIRRVQLVELFHAGETAEKPIRPSPVLALLAVLLLGEAVFVLSRGMNSTLWREHATVCMILTAVGVIGGTYLFFRQFSGWILGVISRRRHYYEGNTVLWSSSLRFQVRGNTSNLTFITLAGAAIILLTSFVVVNYRVQFDAVRMNVPNGIAFEYPGERTSAAIRSTIEASEHPVKDYRRLELIRTRAVTDMSVAFENPQYYEEPVLLMAAKDYNGLVAWRGDDEQVQLRGEDAVSLSQGTDLARTYPPEARPEFTVGAASRITLRLAEMKDYALLGWATIPGHSMEKKPAVIVVSDGAFELARQAGEAVVLELYQISDPEHAEDLSAEVYRLAGEGAGPGWYYSSYADVYSIQIESSSLLLFAAAFLALIAVFALASVVYFRQLKVAAEEARQYAVLRKLGVDNRRIRSAIRKQLVFIFAPPLILAVMFSWLVIRYYMLESLTDFPDLPRIVMSILGIYGLVYLFFYLSSASLYYRIVNQR